MVSLWQLTALMEIKSEPTQRLSQLHYHNAIIVLVFSLFCFHYRLTQQRKLLHTHTILHAFHAVMTRRWTRETPLTSQTTVYQSPCFEHRFCLRA